MPNTIPEFPEGTRYFIWVEGNLPFSQYFHVVMPPRGETKTYRDGVSPGTTEYTRRYILDILRVDNEAPQWQEVTREGFLQAQADPLSPRQNLRAYIQYFTGRLPPPPPPPPPPPRTFYKIGVPKNKLP